MKQQLHIRIEVRNNDGTIIRDSNGSKQTDLSYNTGIDERQIEHEVRYIHNTLKAWMPTNKIDIEVSQLNEDTRTYNLLYSFYGNENRFVKHD